MPNKRKSSNKRSRRPRRRQARGFATNVRTVVAPGNRYRTLLNDNVSSTGQIGSVNQLQIQLKGSRFSTLFARVAQLKINKIGILVLPQTYMEFCIRGINSPNLDNRVELINQVDCIKVFVQSKPKTYWFKPNQNSTRGWLDVSSSSETFTTGLWVFYTGQNQLNSSGSEILFQILIDVSFQGLDFLKA